MKFQFYSIGKGNELMESAIYAEFAQSLLRIIWAEQRSLLDDSIKYTSYRVIYAYPQHEL